MSGGAKKAAPREKNHAFGDQRYKVTNVPHFINGSIEPVGAFVFLPTGVKAGKYLVAVDDDGNEIKPKAEPEKAPAKEEVKK
jgi:hypothetical protein